MKQNPAGPQRKPPRGPERKTADHERGLPTEDLLRGLDPVFASDARVLILGSMPGEESLRQGRYYAHPRNSFWPIMGALFGAGLDVPYPVRLDRLRARRIAVWDVVRCCRRPGSLDAAIEPNSIQLNDLAGLLRRCPDLHVVFFNGRTAQQLFQRHVAPGLPADVCNGDRVYLPSTSPAHASLSFRSKLASWSRIADRLR